METNKNKYSLGNYKFLQFFSEPQGGGNDGGNPEGSNGGGEENTGNKQTNPEQSGSGGGTDNDQNPNETPKVFDEKYVAGLRKENAKYRTERNEATQKFETFANDLKGFLEKNGAQIDSTESQSVLEALDKIIGESKSSVLNAELQRVAVNHNVIDSEVLEKLIDKSALKFENGNYVGLEEQVKAIVEAKPYLVKQTQEQTQPPKGGQGTGGAPKKITQSELDKMTPNQIATALANGELNHLLG